MPDHDTLTRRLGGPLLELLGGLRAVLLQGPRQAGKTTLARLVAEEIGGRFATLDDAATLEAARADPVGFLESFGRPLALDEFQRGGEPLVLALKAELDRSRAKGRFLLLGSTNFLAIPTISESLAGRLGLVTLWPFSQGELQQSSGDFLQRAFEDPEGLRSVQSRLGRRDYLERLCRGGFPEVQDLTPRQRHTWFRSYVETLIERDVAEHAEVRDGSGVRALMKLAAAHTAQERVIKTLADGIGVKQQTAAQWLRWLEAVFAVSSLPAWSRQPRSRTVRRPKLHLTDSGLAAHLCAKSPAALADPTDPVTGPLLETFVVGELARQSGWSEQPVELYHLREHDGPEVDLILEAPDGRIVAIEVKATQSRPSLGAPALEALAGRLADSSRRFVHGFVLYTGPRAYALGEHLTALPIEALWR